MKAKRLKAVTPVGTLIYPHLNEPDREFDAMGIYHTKMRVSGADAQEFMEKVEAFRDEQYQQECSQRGKKKLNQNPLPLLLLHHPLLKHPHYLRVYSLRPHHPCADLHVRLVWISMRFRVQERPIEFPLTT